MIKRNQEFYTSAHTIIWGALLYLGSKEWRSGESARLPPMWPGFKSRRRRHIWVEFVIGSLLCSERFSSGYSGFPLSSKTNCNISKFQFDQESGRRRTTLWMCYLQIIINLFIYYENSLISVNGEEITYIKRVLGWLQLG